METYLPFSFLFFVYFTVFIGISCLFLSTHQMMARGMDLIFLQASPMLWLFEREPLNLISFAFHLNHHQSEIIIDFFKDKL
jgi:hypothetical protein